MRLCLGGPAAPMPARSSGAPCALPHPGSAVARTGPVARPRPWTDHVFSQIAVFFSKMAMVTFRGAYAALAYVAQQAVDTYGWLETQRDARWSRYGGDDAGAASSWCSNSWASWQRSVTRAHSVLSWPARSGPGGDLGNVFALCFLWILVGALH